MTKTIITALGRPTITNALLWSLGVHLSVAAASSYPWARLVDRVTLAGTRNVVQVEVSIAAEAPRPADEVAVPMEVEPPPPVAEQQVVARPPDESLAQVDQVPLDPVPQETPLSERTVAVPAPGSPVASPDSTHVVRREPIDTPPDSSKTPPLHLPRRELAFDRPQISVAAVQIAGVDDTLPPELLDNTPPTYPAAAIARGLEGTVLLRLYIATTGMVERVEVVTSSGHGILDAAAVEAVSRWRARPAQRAGIAVPTVELLPVRFRL